MATKQYDNYADLITFTRASSGTALRPVGYGAELVTNGGFDDGTTGWSAGSTATLSVVDGQLNVFTTAPDTFSNANQAITTEAGKVYKLTATKVSQSSNSEWGVSDTPTGARFASFVVSETGTKELVFVAIGTTTYIQLASQGADGLAIYDNISVKEVIFDRATDPLVLFNHPNNVPRIEYDADGNRLGLLIEEQRANLILQSDDLTVSPWTVSDATQLAATGPFVNSTGFDIIEDVTADGIIHSTQQVISFTSGTTYTVSVWAKSSNRRLSIAGANPSVFPASVIFDLQNGTVAAEFSGSGTIQDFGNGWYRCSATDVAASTAATNLRFAISLTDNDISYAGDGVSKVTLYGAQLEAGSFPTSYIPTSGSPATRNPDIASIPTSAFGYNQKAGTVVCEASGLSPTTGQYVFDLHDTTANEQIYLRLDSTSIGRGVVFDGGSVVFNSDATGSTPSANAFVKYALSASLNDFAVTANGASPVTDTSGTMPTVTQLALGGREGASTGYLNGHIKSIRYWPRRLTNAQLQELTS